MKTIQISDQELESIIGGAESELWSNIGFVVGFVTYHVKQAVSTIVSGIESGEIATVNAHPMLGGMANQ